MKAWSEAVVVGLLLLVALLSGCGGKVIPAPVEERSAAPPRRIDHHIVSPGETLYSIAWRYGMDAGRLGAANGIGPPYRIYPGQRLVLKEAAPGSVAGQRADRESSVTASRPSARQSGASVRGSAVAGSGKAGQPPVAELATSWQWPASGSILRHFRRDPPEHKGIDIQGKFGEPVCAANSGTVVYAGHGLVGYGNLLIIRHSERYLSAYAHNSRLLVREGQTVKVGERIAEIGDSGTDSVRLHFEVRRDGRPVDPLELLPRR